MSNRVIIADYGAGNVFSVARAIERVGGEPCLSADPKVIASAERLILPGVGAFQACMGALEEQDLVEPIMEYARSERPFLGICVGMQLMFHHSLEFGKTNGLGLVAGHVGPIPVDDGTHRRRVPHIGWSALTLPPGRENWNGTLLDGAEPGKTAMYFVHSYSCQPADADTRLAEADYEGWPICAAIQRDNMTATQCHPERSGQSGLRFFENFLKR